MIRIWCAIDLIVSPSSAIICLTRFHTIQSRGVSLQFERHSQTKTFFDNHRGFHGMELLMRYFAMTPKYPQ